MKRFIPLLVASAIALIACSNDKVAGFTTVETQNAMLITVTYQDESPVARRVATLRPLSYVRDFSDVFETPQKTVVSDSLGRFAIDSLPFQADTFTLELLDHGQGVFEKIPTDLLDERGDSATTMNLMMENLGSVSGKIDCPSEGAFATVQIYGTDRFVAVDDSCNFHIDSLAPADYKLRVLVQDSVIETEAVVVPDENTQVDIHIGGKVEEIEPAEEPVEEPAEDAGEKVVDYVEIINFENGFKSSLKAPALEATAYYVTDTSVTSDPTPENWEDGFVEAGAGREGTAFHWKSSAGTGLGAYFGIFICHGDTPCDLRGLDSAEFYIRGKGRYSFSIESIGDSSNHGKAMYYDTLKEDSASGRNDADAWIRKVVRPIDFVDTSDHDWGNIGWEIASQKVTNLAITAYGEAEIWLDDIRLYGLKPSDMK